jgi:hypothetical protein
MPRVLHGRHSCCRGSLRDFGQKLLNFSSISLEGLQLRLQQLYLFVGLSCDIG